LTRPQEVSVSATVSLRLAAAGLLPAAGQLAGHPHMRHPVRRRPGCY